MLGEIFRRRSPQLRDAGGAPVETQGDVQVTATGQVRSIGGRGQSGQVVTETSTLGLPPLWRGINLQAGAIGMLPMFTTNLAGAVLEPTPAVLVQPWPFEDRPDTIAAFVWDLLLNGNAVGLWEQWDTRGWPHLLKPLRARDLAIGMVDGRPTYRLGNGQLVDYTGVFHVRGPKFPGELRGLGIVEALGASIGLAQALEGHAQQYFGFGGIPPGYLKSSLPEIDRELADEYADRWQEKVTSGGRRPPMLAADMEFKELAPKAQEDQLIEARQFSLTQAALMLNMDPEWLGAPNSGRDYANISQRFAGLVRWTLEPILQRFEHQFGRLGPRGTLVKFDRDAGYKSTSEQLDEFAKGIAAGVYVPQECRDWLGIGPMPATRDDDPLSDPIQEADPNA